MDRETAIWFAVSSADCGPGLKWIHGIRCVLPDRVEISGTIRNVDEKVRRELFDELERAMGVARALGGDFELRIEEG